MASLHDLAALIAARRAALEHAFDSEISKMKITYGAGAGAVERALHLARRIEHKKQPDAMLPRIPSGWPAP